MGLKEPQRYFKTVSNGLEKIGFEAKRVELDFSVKRALDHRRRPSSVSSSGLRTSGRSDNITTLVKCTSEIF